MNNNDQTYISKNWVWAVLGAILVFWLLGQGSKSNKPYHSDIYSSWEEERIDELEADVAYLYDKLKKNDD